MKIYSLPELYDIIDTEEKIMVDVLRQIVIENTPDHIREKISYNVPFFYGTKGLCFIWPASIPRGGIKKEVLLGFWYGNKLKDDDGYLVHGKNKRVYYKIFQRVEEIDQTAIVKVLKEAVALDMIAAP